MRHYPVSNRPVDKFFYYLDKVTEPFNDPLNRLVTSAGEHVGFVCEDIGAVLSGRGTLKSYVVTGMVAAAAVTAAVALVLFVKFIISSTLTGFGKAVAFVCRAKTPEGEVLAQLIGQAILAGLMIGTIRSL